ncbi:MAG: anion transporter [Elusimicrobia bacterium]|nr:anion transporter [Elusimicrobiota bacterium]MDE2425540.1 anion transporter [Elusimicrobiota bacterium]
MTLAAVAIFSGTYVLLSFQQSIPGLYISRSAAALLGAVAMVAFGVLRLDQAYRLVDLNTMVFLLGMMIVVGYLEISGFFVEVELFILSRARTARGLLAMLIFSSGVLSALFMNDAVCLMLAPLLIRLISRARLNLNPYLIALAVSANIGSVMTPMGNPQNMIVTLHSAISFSRFTLVLAPLAVAGLFLSYWTICFLYPRDFAPGRALSTLNAIPPRSRSRLLYVCLVGVGLMLALLAFNVSPPLAAISIAALLILAGATKPRDAFRYVNWDILLMFAGLFVVMGGLRHSGIVEAISGMFGDVLGAPLPARVGALSVVSAILSNIVSNVPCVIFLSNIIPGGGGHQALWLALAMSSTMAGNLTIIGSVANLIVFESAKSSTRVDFWEYFRVGAPLTILLIFIGTFYLSFVFS